MASQRGQVQNPLPVAVSQTFTSLGLTETRRWPSGLNATLWPRKVSASWPVTVSHTFSVLS